MFESFFSSRQTKSSELPMLEGALPCKIAVVIPALNEEAGIGTVLSQIKNVLAPLNYSTIVVDGNSIDKTFEIAKNEGADLICQKGKGYGNALKEGFSYACNEKLADIVVMMDADGTYDAKDIPSLIVPILSNEADVVVGNRFQGMETGAMSLINIFGNKLISLVVRLMVGIKVSDTQSGMRAIRANLLNRTLIESEGMPFATEMFPKFKKEGARFAEISISYRVRKGNSKLNPFRDGFRIFKVIFEYVGK